MKRRAQSKNGLLATALATLLSLHDTNSFQPLPFLNPMTTTTRPFRPSTPGTTPLHQITTKRTSTTKTSIDATTPQSSIPLSDAHYKTLRKETQKRAAQNALPKHTLSPDETRGPPFSSSSLATVAQLLTDHELVQVRGISRDEPKGVFEISNALERELSLEMGREVFVVQRKGFAAVYYCGWEDEEGEGKEGRIRLWTSVGKKNSWVKREKPARDNRGQIIKGGED